MKTIETSKGVVNLRDIKLKDSKQARSYAGRLGGFNEQDYFTQLYILLADKDVKFLDELSHDDDIKLVSAIKDLINETIIGDEKKQ